MNDHNIKVLKVDLINDPIWEIGDIRSLSIFQTGSYEPPAIKYTVIGRTRIDDQVRYELKPW